MYTPSVVRSTGGRFTPRENKNVFKSRIAKKENNKSAVVLIGAFVSFVTALIILFVYH